MILFFFLEEVQNEFDFQKSRIHFCILIEQLFSKSKRNCANSDVLNQFKMRIDLYKLCESWSGFGSRGEHLRETEANVVNKMLDSISDSRERAKLSSTVVEDRKILVSVSIQGFFYSPKLWLL
jgi:hypothetical protein